MILTRKNYNLNFYEIVLIGSFKDWNDFKKSHKSADCKKELIVRSCPGLFTAASLRDFITNAFSISKIDLVSKLRISSISL